MDAYIMSLNIWVGQSNQERVIASSHRRYVRKGEALVPSVSRVCYSCVVEPWDEHYHPQNCKENACIQKNWGQRSGNEEKRIVLIYIFVVIFA